MALLWHRDFVEIEKQLYGVEDPVVVIVAAIINYLKANSRNVYLLEVAFFVFIQLGC